MFVFGKFKGKYQKKNREENKKKKSMGLRDDILVVKNNRFFNPLIKGDSRIAINCYNKKNNIPNSIMLLMQDI